MYNKDALSDMLVAMGINTIGQKESQNSHEFLQEIAKDFELFQNFQEAKKQSATIPVVKEIAKNNAHNKVDLNKHKSDILDILNGTQKKNTSNLEEKLPQSKQKEININKLPPLHIPSSLEASKTLFTQPSSSPSLETHGKESLSGKFDIKPPIPTSSRNLITKLSTRLELTPEQRQELSEAKQKIVENFPFTTDYLDRISKEIQFDKSNRSTYLA